MPALITSHFKLLPYDKMLFSRFFESKLCAGKE